MKTLLTNIKEKNYTFPVNLESIIEFCKTKLTAATAESIAWIGLIIIHAATVPSILAVMSGLTDKMPPVDLVLFIWAGLTLFFIRAAILKDMLMVVTIGLGFIIHSVLLALITFK